MEKVTQEKLKKDAKEKLLLAVLLTAVWIYLMIDSHFAISVVVEGGVLLGLIWLTEGYQSIRLISDSTYLRHYWISKHDERNIQIENAVYRRMFQVISILYFAGMGGILGYFSMILSNNQYILLAALLAGLTLIFFWCFMVLSSSINDVISDIEANNENTNSRIA